MTQTGPTLTPPNIHTFPYVTLSLVSGGTSPVICPQAPRSLPTPQLGHFPTASCLSHLSQKPRLKSCTLLMSSTSPHTGNESLNPGDSKCLVRSMAPGSLECPLTQSNLNSETRAVSQKCKSDLVTTRINHFSDPTFL